MVSLAITVQTAPSTEYDPVKVLPTRCKRTHFGAAWPAMMVFTLTPPTVVRRWKSAPAAAVTFVIALTAFAARPSRIITPAFDQLSVFTRLSTFAVMVPSPVSDWCAKRKPSLVLQMSEPDASITIEFGANNTPPPVVVHDSNG